MTQDVPQETASVRSKQKLRAAEPGPKEARSAPPPGLLTADWRWAAALLVLLFAAAAWLAYGGWRPWRQPSAGPTKLGELPVVRQDEALKDAPATKTKRLPLDPLEPETSAELIAEAGRVAEDLAQRFPNNPDALEMLARYQLDFADVDEAAATWRRCLELNPQYAYAHVGLAKVATRQGKLKEAIEHWRRAILADPANPGHQIELGKALLAAGDADEAAGVLAEVVRANPASAQAHAELGSAQLQQRDNAAAKASFEAALARDPRFATAHYGLATACARLGLVEEARRAEAQVREFRSGRTEALRGERTGYDDDQAARVDTARLYGEMGGVLAAENELSLAEQLWRRAARLDPENRASRQALSWLSLQQNEPLESIRMLRELARIEPDNPVYPAQIAKVYVDLGRVSDAQAAIEEFAAAQPENPLGQRTLAEFHFNVTGRAKAALAHAQRAAELSGAAIDWSLASAAHERLGDFDAAVAAQERAVTAAPGNLRYAQVLALLKERQAAGSKPGAARPGAAPPASEGSGANSADSAQDAP